MTQTERNISAIDLKTSVAEIQALSSTIAKKAVELTMSADAVLVSFLVVMHGIVLADKISTDMMYLKLLEMAEAFRPPLN